MTRHLTTKRLGLAALVLGLWGCTEPKHMGYDYGRAYTQVITAQADLTRPSAQGLMGRLGYFGWIRGRRHFM